MPRERSPNRDKAFQIYKEHGGKIELVEIAAMLNISDGTVRGWKNKDSWDAKLNGTFQKNKRNAPKDKVKKSSDKNEPEIEIIEDDELNDRQRLFCHYYLKSFNQTLAAIKAGYEPERAHITGSELVRNRKVAAEIRRLKGKMTEELFIDAMDVLEKYIKIAFSDITDYLKFGQREVQVMGSFGPLYEGKGKNRKPIMKTVNYVDFNESYQIDGTIISEVKQGKDGISIKMADKIKALEKLADYFDLFPDKFKRRIEEEKLKLDKLKVTGEGEGNGQEAIDDFIKATTMSQDEIKAMFEGEEDETVQE